MLYPILDTQQLHGLDLSSLVSSLVDAGIPRVQIRHKGQFDREFIHKLEQCRRIKPDLILNDRADVAALLGFGLHVGQTDLPPAEARSLIGPHACLGFSTHSQAQLDAAQTLPVDYLAIGPVFATQSKANPDPVVGPGPFRSAKPLVAIGGITLASAPLLIANGIESVAVISALWQPPYTLKSFRENVKRWLTQLNSSKA